MVDFCTLGMFIIDEIEFPPPIAPVKDVLGGAGSYSALGARIFSPPPQSQAVGWIVDCGSDFPAELRETIASWGTGALIRETPHRLTTRGWNGYGEHEHRAFRYTTPKRRLDHQDLTDSHLLWSKAFHLICSPRRCIELVKDILGMRHDASRPNVALRPIFIWEPVPDRCVHDELANCFLALQHIDIVSPNHAELGGFFGVNTVTEDHADHRTIEKLCDEWLQGGVGPDKHGAIVVRAGKDGCMIASQSRRKWFPAFHRSAGKVIDPTGGGNAFLGGFAIGMVRRQASPQTDELEEAALLGTIAASFAIEQVGMPVLGNQGRDETWNETRVKDRIAEYRKALKGYVQP